MNLTILAGGYDTFIATYLFNSVAGTLDLASTFPTGPNISWISPHPTNASILYAVNEISPIGALQSFTTTPEGVLTGPHDTISSEGDRPAFTAALSTGQVGVVNYNSGTGRIIPTDSTFLFFDNDASPLITFPPPVNNLSHPHMVVEFEGEVIIPDLGGDKLWRLTHSADAGPGDWDITGLIPQPLFSGPRHMRIFDDRIFVLHQLSNTLTVQPIPAPPNGTSTIIDSESILPHGLPEGAEMCASEILISTPTSKFPTPYIYASNRNQGVQDPRGDAIAIFEHVNQGRPDEELRLVTEVFTGLNQIRGMEIGLVSNGGDEFLIAAGVAGEAGTVVYRRVEGGRNLEEVVRNLDIPTRSTFIWLP
ncbi:putative isomerase YbhE [Rhodocollybia butyracea]|uniref:Isomerase YbhE n=1 Tax=Rhodocollybia butyracea TaxID=206335 RepID=A0A9P5U1Q6_9AGAR|nr:putative isomerase YbhE [Rhodocollybia butyracea]